jgi:hypothetical protein
MLGGVVGHCPTSARTHVCELASGRMPAPSSILGQMHAGVYGMSLGGHPGLLVARGIGAWLAAVAAMSTCSLLLSLAGRLEAEPGWEVGGNCSMTLQGQPRAPGDSPSESQSWVYRVSSSPV